MKDNVLPARARAVVNFRIKPGDTVNDVLAHVKAVVNDRRVEGRLPLRSFSEGGSSTSPKSRFFGCLPRSLCLQAYTRIFNAQRMIAIYSSCRPVSIL